MAVPSRLPSGHQQHVDLFQLYQHIVSIGGLGSYNSVHLAWQHLAECGVAGVEPNTVRGKELRKVKTPGPKAGLAAGSEDDVGPGGGSSRPRGWCGVEEGMGRLCSRANLQRLLVAFCFESSMRVLIALMPLSACDSAH